MEAGSEFLIFTSCGVRVCVSSLFFNPSALDMLTQATSLGLESLETKYEGNRTVCRVQCALPSADLGKKPKNSAALEVELKPGL